MGHTVFGGVHPAARKESTRRKPVVPLEHAPERVTIPLEMCALGGAVPTVRVGDKVTLGQVIAKPEGDGVPVHASVSGQVEDIGDRPHPWGGTCRAIVIRNDGQDTPCSDLPAPADVKNTSRRDLLERLRQAVAGLK